MPKITETVDIEIEVVCWECGKDLDTKADGRFGHVLSVEPCSTCLDLKYDEGLKDGRDEHN